MPIVEGKNVKVTRGMIKDWELDEWHTIVHENKWKCDELLYITVLKLMERAIWLH